MRLGNYVSNFKWLATVFTRLIVRVENWTQVLLYYLLSVHTTPLTVKFRNGETLTVPKNYIFMAIAETLFLNVYNFGHLPPGSVIVDVGASVGDFVLLASRTPESRVYAYEPSAETFRYMKLNVFSNRRRSVRLFNAPANGNTLDSILIRYGESKIDFLKVDCEGCEYRLFLDCSAEALLRVERVAMEIHETPEASKAHLVNRLKTAGFMVTERKSFGYGHYLYASRAST